MTKSPENKKWREQQFDCFAKNEITPAEFPKVLSNRIKKEIYPKKITKIDKNAKKTCSL